MEYVIRHFDETTGSIVVEFIGVGTWNIDLPIVDGKYPEGEELENCIQSFAPTFIVDRKDAINTGVSNTETIKALVQPAPEQPIDQAALEAQQAQQLAEEQLFNAKVTAIVEQVLANRTTV